MPTIVFADTTDHSPTAINNLGTRTHQIDLTGLTAGSYRQSAKADLGYPFAHLWEVTGVFEPTSAPTAGGEVLVWVGFSHSSTAGTGNPGNLSGSDSAYVGYGAAKTDADENINQLDFVGAIPVSADADEMCGHLGIIVARQRYVMIVVKNDTSVNFIADAVEMSVRLSPIKP